MSATNFPVYSAFDVAGEEALRRAFDPVYLDPSSVSAMPQPDKWWFEDQAQRASSLFKYGDRPRLDVFESNEYTHWTAWAHTEPDRHVIMMRPPESIDYSLGVFAHEVVHNYFPGLGNEDHVTQIGNGPLFRYIGDSFRYSRH